VRFVVAEKGVDVLDAVCMFKAGEALVRDEAMARAMQEYECAAGRAYEATDPENKKVDQRYITAPWQQRLVPHHPTAVCAEGSTVCAVRGTRGVDVPHSKRESQPPTKPVMNKYGRLPDGCELRVPGWRRARHEMRQDWLQGFGVNPVRKELFHFKNNHLI
jgi:hypothetical protein